MPAKLDRCVRKVKSKVKPRGSRTRTESAWAICMAAMKKLRNRNKRSGTKTAHKSS